MAVVCARWSYIFVATITSRSAPDESHSISEFVGAITIALPGARMVLGLLVPPQGEGACMMRRIALVIVFVGLVMVLSAWMAFAQGFQGGIRGSVKDDGGAVPGAAVTLTNEATSLTRAAVTNATGEYAFAAVEPGTYTIKVAIQGYKTAERIGLRVGTQSFLVIDQKLEVGTIEESITVSVQSPLVETANASHGTVLDRVALETLPAPGRSAFLMAISIPTVIASGDGQFNRQQDQSNASFLSLGGGTRRGNNYTLDGVSITDIVNRAVANPTMEALDDVKV